MYALLHPFVQIALLRCKPQDLPASTLLLKLALSAHVVLGVFMFTSRLALPQALLAGAVSTLVMCVLVASLLFANRRSARIVQTLTAMAGSDVVVGIAALPVTSWLQAPLDGASASGLTALLFLLLVAWNLIVAGHVLRHALSSPLPLGVVLALVLYMISVNVIHALFPGMA
ncbi:MAG: hypothetical protein ACI8W7_000597 [Gammaproteobacteria bacterium]